MAPVDFGPDLRRCLQLKISYTVWITCAYRFSVLVYL